MFTDHYFDKNRHGLAVDTEALLAHHRVVYGHPIREAENAAAMGTGKVGAAVWNEDGLHLQVTAVDASPYTSLSSGYVRLQSSPALPEDGAFRQIMDLYRGSVTTDYGDAVKTTVFGDLDTETLGILVEDHRDNVSEYVVDLGLWDTSTLENRFCQLSLEELDKWRTVSRPSGDAIPQISRGLDTKCGFGYVLGAEIEGAEYTVELLDSRTFRLHIQPSPRFVVWINNATKVEAEDRDVPAWSREILADCLTRGADRIKSEYEAYWAGFWKKSFIQISDGSAEADFTENQWYLSLYYLAIASRGVYPCHFYNSVFKWAEDSNIHWSAYYTYFNQRSINHGWLASDHIDLLAPHLKFYTDRMKISCELTETICRQPGLKLSEGMGIDGTGMYETGNNYNGRLYTDSLEFCLLMYLKCQYSNDETYCRDTLFPYLTESVRFYVHRLRWDGDYYYMENSNVLEEYWDATNPITDMAAIRSVFPIFIRLSGEYGVEHALAKKCQDILDHLSPLYTENSPYGLIYLPCKPPVPPMKNTQNPEMELMWPYGVTGIDAPDRELAMATWRSRKCGYQIWSPDMVAAARLGMGNEAFGDIAGMTKRNHRHPNGFHDDSNGALESNGLIITAYNEMLLQSYDGVIRVFPAMPDGDFVGRFRLLARGGFEVSAEYAQGKTRYIGLYSRYGNEAVVKNPWKGERVWVRKLDFNLSPEEQVLIDSNADVFSFGTIEKGVYLIHPADSIPDDKAHNVLTVEPNNACKQALDRILGN